MVIISKPRYCGKTVQLIQYSAITREPIICSDMMHKTQVKETAKKMGYDIPEPLTIIELTSKDSKRDMYLVDDLDHVFQTLINMQIDIATISSEHIHMER